MSDSAAYAKDTRVFRGPRPTTVIGIPGRPVKRVKMRVPSTDLDQVHVPDPQMQEMCRVKDKLEILESELALLKSKLKKQEEQI